MEERESEHVEDKRIVVGVIGHISPSTRTTLMASLLQSNILLIDDPEEIAKWVEAAREQDVLSQVPREILDMSPYGFDIFKRSKGEKKRERAHNRRLWGKGNSF